MTNNIPTLKDLRQNKGLTLKECAYKVGVTLRQYQNYESGGCGVPTGRLADLADIYGVPVLDVYYACVEKETSDD